MQKTITKLNRQVVSSWKGKSARYSRGENSHFWNAGNVTVSVRRRNGKGKQSD